MDISAGIDLCVDDILVDGFVLVIQLNAIFLSAPLGIVADGILAAIRRGLLL